MGRKVKQFLVVLLLLVVVAAGIGYYAYNKGPLDIQHSKSIKATATELYTLYSTDSVSAQKNYSGKIIEVTGFVTEVSQNLQNEKIILLQTSTPGAYINCTMEGLAGEIKPNETIVLKGLCSGMGQGDPDLGIKGDVYLTRCFIIK
ncbi:MAG TPA: hypothetical protein VK498_03405 [Ferruginibacter sp.]|nr:hypothetical protein [Ferruginibacter sp.]